MTGSPAAVGLTGGPIGALATASDPPRAGARAMWPTEMRLSVTVWTTRYLPTRSRCSPVGAEREGVVGVGVPSWGANASDSSACLAAAAISESVRSDEPGSRTSMSLATASTPRTRSAARSARQRLVYESTDPVRVTTPFFTTTPISFGWSSASHAS